jgi:hypothetical protein
MTNTATLSLRLLPARIGRAATIVAVSIAVVALVALAFAVGRWTDGSGSAQAPTRVGPVLVQPALDCQGHGPC